MATNRVINSQAFHDGKVILYQLENRPKQKELSPILGDGLMDQAAAWA